MTIGKNVKRLRLEKKLTQDGLAKKAGLSQVYISKLEGGLIHDTKSDTLERLAKALKVPTKELKRPADKSSA